MVGSFQDARFETKHRKETNRSKQLIAVIAVSR